MHYQQRLQLPRRWAGQVTGKMAEQFCQNKMLSSTRYVPAKAARTHLGVALLLGGGLEVRARLVWVFAQSAAHGPQDAAELVVVLGQLALRHAAALALRLLQRLLQVAPRILRARDTVFSF